MDEIDRLIDELKEASHVLRNPLAREHMEFALAHARQAWRAEKYNEMTSSSETHKVISGFLDLCEKLTAKSKGRAGDQNKI